MALFTLFLDLEPLEKLYAVCAMIGGSVFVVRILLTMLGLGDHDADVSPDMDVGADVIGDSDMGFRLLSVQGLAGFLLMFGVVGLALSLETQLSNPLTGVCAFGAGTAMAFIIAGITSLMLSLQSSGNVNVQSAVGAEGTVYLTIPKDGTGKVQVAVQERLLEFEAESKDKREIKTGQRIKVVTVVGGGRLIVEKVG